MVDAIRDSAWVCFRSSEVGVNESPCQRYPPLLYPYRVWNLFLPAFSFWPVYYFLFGVSWRECCVR